MKKLVRHIKDKDNEFGFTLTEILVAVAIVGILAAIIIPVSASLRQKGLQSELNNKAVTVSQNIKLMSSSKYNGFYRQAMEEQVRVLVSSSDPDGTTTTRFVATEDGDDYCLSLTKNNRTVYIKGTNPKPTTVSCF